MAATKGNQWWKLRSSHGRKRIFETPEILWEAAKEYFEATDKRKWKIIDHKGKDAIRVETPVDTPYTLTGLFIFLDIDEKTWRNYREKKDFVRIVTHIERVITTQKVEGAMVGVFNPNIVARLENLTEKTENTHKITGGDVSFNPKGEEPETD